MSADPNDPSPKVDPASKVDLERRRVPLERKISLKFKEFRGFITEYSQNLSMGGMFIRTTSPKPVGTIFDCRGSITSRRGSSLLVSRLYGPRSSRRSMFQKDVQRVR